MRTEKVAPTEGVSCYLQEIYGEISRIGWTVHEEARIPAVLHAPSRGHMTNYQEKNSR
jgi:hypothetical protein